MTVGRGNFRAAPLAAVDQLGIDNRTRIRNRLERDRLGIARHLHEWILLVGRRWRRADKFGDSRIKTRVHSDMHVEIERPRDFVAQIGARSLAGDTPNNLADQISESDRMVAVPGAGLPPRLMRCER